MLRRGYFTANYSTVIYLFVLFGLSAQKSPHAGIRVNPTVRHKVMNDESSPRQKETPSQSRDIALSQKRVISLGKLSSSNHMYSKNGGMTPRENTNSFGAPNTNSWIPSRNPQDYSKVDVRVMGQSVNTGSINHLQPDTSPETEKKLRKILLGNVDREWTSPKRPHVLRQRGVSGGRGNNMLDPELWSASQSLEMRFESNGSAFAIDDREVKHFREWLVRKATCEMEFIWEDLGPLFWPRWIRRGVCLNKPERSCSWPPGMKCRPSGSRALQLLHWKCEDSAQVQSRKRAVSNYQRSQVRLPRSITIQPVSGSTKVMRRRNIYPYSRGPSQHRGRKGRNSRRNRNFSPEQRNERRRKRAFRLIQMLSKNENGHSCYWQVQKYLISDSCTCSCA